VLEGVVGGGLELEFLTKKTGGQEQRLGLHRELRKYNNNSTCLYFHSFAHKYNTKKKVLQLIKTKLNNTHKKGGPHTQKSEEENLLLFLLFAPLFF
jgi:hypothetical protein